MRIACFLAGRRIQVTFPPFPKGTYSASTQSAHRQKRHLSVLLSSSAWHRLWDCGAGGIFGRPSVSLASLPTRGRGGRAVRIQRPSKRSIPNAVSPYSQPCLLPMGCSKRYGLLQVTEFSAPPQQAEQELQDSVPHLLAIVLLPGFHCREYGWSVVPSRFCKSHSTRPRPDVSRVGVQLHRREASLKWCMRACNGNHWTNEMAASTEFRGVTRAISHELQREV